MKFRYTVKDLDFFAHEFEVDEESWSSYTSTQREHILTQQKRKAADSFKREAYDFMQCERVLEDEVPTGDSTED